jgi:hypothetical protein
VGLRCLVKDGGAPPACAATSDEHFGTGSTPLFSKRRDLLLLAGSPFLSTVYIPLPHFDLVNFDPGYRRFETALLSLVPVTSSRFLSRRSVNDT